MQTLIKRPISLKAPPPKPPTIEELDNGLAACARLSVDQPEHEKFWAMMAEKFRKAKGEFYPENVTP